jgi:hypothetical protein
MRRRDVQYDGCDWYDFVLKLPCREVLDGGRFKLHDLSCRLVQQQRWSGDMPLLFHGCCWGVIVHVDVCPRDLWDDDLR